MLQPIPPRTPPTLESIRLFSAKNLPPRETVQQDPAPNTYWSHVDGGLYRVILTATDTSTYAKSVVYEHIWPFDSGHYTRPLSEWTSDRFWEQRPNCLLDYVKLEEHRGHFQALITRNRQERKRQELAAIEPGPSYVNQDPDHAPPTKPVLASNESGATEPHHRFVPPFEARGVSSFSGPGEGI